MLKRIAPAVTVILAVLFDTSIMPLFYNGHYSLMLSLILVIQISIMCGRIRGLLYGWIAGLMLDISCGTLGMKLFAYIAIGFIVGFLLDNQPDLYSKSKPIASKEKIQYLLVQFIWISVLLLLYEITMTITQYFANAVFKWVYVRDIVIRVLATSILTIVLSPVAHRLYIGNDDAEQAKRRNTREVKTF